MEETKSKKVEDVDDERDSLRISSFSLPRTKAQISYHSLHLEDTMSVVEDQVGGINEEEQFEWSPLLVCQAIAVFCLAGVAEIMGGWMIWVAVRGNSNGKKPWWYALVGSLVLIAYGFIPTLQPTDTFGRVYAVYGGFFIVLSFIFGWLLDGDPPDAGDAVGGAISLAGVLVILFWPR